MPMRLGRLQRQSRRGCRAPPHRSSMPPICAPRILRRHSGPMPCRLSAARISRDGFIAQMVTPRERQWHHQHQPVISQLLWIVAISCTEPPSMGKAPTQPPSEASRNIFGTCHSNGRHLGPWVARFDLAKVPAKH